jgi:hypothetical protein
MAEKIVLEKKEKATCLDALHADVHANVSVREKWKTVEPMIDR